MAELENELKALIIRTLELEDITIDDIVTSEPLFEDGLGLDSIDALEIGLALQQTYGVEIDEESEETRVHDPTRLGKRRCRIDIEILKSQEGPRPRFRFEAKRLHDTTSRHDYLGDDGLGCFLDGRYAKEDDIAGMLGYVQADSIDSHAQSLEQAMAKDPTRYALRTDGHWKACQIVRDLTSFQTDHDRVGALPAITLLHTLLSFC